MSGTFTDEGTTVMHEFVPQRKDKTVFPSSFKISQGTYPCISICQRERERPIHALFGWVFVCVDLTNVVLKNSDQMQDLGTLETVGT